MILMPQYGFLKEWLFRIYLYSRTNYYSVILIKKNDFVYRLKYFFSYIFGL